VKESGMADIELTAAYASVVEDDDALFIGFAEGEDADEAYVLFRQALSGGPVWFEATDETFGAEDAVATVVATSAGLDITLHPAAAARFGWARSIAVQIGPDCEDAAPALAALQAMLGARFRTEA
jgi:hypothetical protein